MNDDNLKKQQRQPSTRRLSDVLRRISPPDKTSAQWACMESSLFVRLGAETEKRNVKTFFPALLRPLSLACGVAALALAVTIVSIVKKPHDSAVSAARILSVHGKALISSRAEQKPDTIKTISTAQALRGIRKGSIVSTLENSAFIMQLDKGSALEIAAQSDVAFTEMDSAHIVINVERGSILVKVSKRNAGQQFRVVTPRAACVVVGTVFRVDVDSTKSTVLTVYEGRVQFTENSAASPQTRMVATGQRCTTATSMGAVRSIAESETPIKEISTLELLVGPQSWEPQVSGIVDISSKPEGATVIMDTAVVGKTPILLRKPIGTHTVTVSADGHAPCLQSIHIGQDSTTTLSANLTKKPAVRPAPKPRNPPPAFALTPIEPESTLVALPEYVEAMVHFTIGEYQKALGILESIKTAKPIDIKSRMAVLTKINICYLKLGDFSNALKNLKGRCAGAPSAAEKEQKLWEIANMQANCMGDYIGARQTLSQLLAMFPSGKRAVDAYKKLAEVQCMVNDFKAAQATYLLVLQKFRDDPDRDMIVFYLACIADEFHRDAKEAAQYYSQIIDFYPKSAYYKAAYFRRGDCRIKLGKVVEAKMDYKKYLTLDPQGLWAAACVQRLEEVKRQP